MKYFINELLLLGFLLLSATTPTLNDISTMDALVFTTEKIRKEIDNNHFVAAAFFGSVKSLRLYFT